VSVFHKLDVIHLEVTTNNKGSRSRDLMRRHNDDDDDDDDDTAYELVQCVLTQLS